MKINLLDIKGFGRLSNLIIRPGAGFNIIYEENEAGKSTLQAFIRAMLYGLRSGKRSKDGTLPPVKHYKPWNGDQYSGVMEYTLSDNSVYRVGRNFEKGTVNIHDGNANNITNDFPHAKDTGPKFAEEHLGLDEETFNNSVFIGQMQCEIDNDGRKTLVGKLSNLATTGSEELSLSRAVKCLETELLERVGTDRSSVRPLNVVNARLNELELKRQELAQLNEKYLDTVLECQEKKNLLAKLRDELKGKEQLREWVKLSKLSALKDEYMALAGESKQLGSELEKYKKMEEEYSGFAGIDDETVSRAQLFLYDKKRAEEEILSLEEETRKVRDKIQRTEETLDPDDIFRQKTASVEEILRERGPYQEGSRKKTEMQKKYHRYKIYGAVGAALTTLLLVLYIAMSAPVFLGTGLALAVISSAMFFNSLKNKVIEELREDRLPKALQENGFPDLNGYLSYKETQIKKRSELEFLKQEVSEREKHLAELKNKLDNINDVLNSIISKAGIIYSDYEDAVGKIARGTEAFKKARQQKNIILAEMESIENRCKSCLREAALILGRPLGSIGELEKITEGLKDRSAVLQEETDEKEINEEIKLLEERIKSTELQIAALEARLAEVPGEGELARVMEETEKLRDKKRSLEKLGESLSLAISILNETALKLQRDFTPALNNEMSRYMSRLSSDRYRKVLANDKLQVNLEVPETDELVLVNRLSGGTIDQVYFSMRMAAVSLMEKGKEKLPIFLDEPFSQYDENRVKKAFELLKDISEDRQVFFFTCRKREFELAREVFGEKMHRIRLTNAG